MQSSFLPRATPLDPTENPPSSTDPLGTVTVAEQLADVLFPGMTARMWRARHLTFVALAALVAERAAEASPGNDSIQLEARLGFERLFVSAITAQRIQDETEWSAAARSLPGIGLARRAFHANRQPLGRHNFLKGQAINGPFGVMQRLARDLDIIDEDNRLSRYGQELLLVWSDGAELPGLLDESSAKSTGARWLGRLTRDVIDHVVHGNWPSATWKGWHELPHLLRPDHPSARERRLIFRLLTSPNAPVRQRCIEYLLHPQVVDAYRHAFVDQRRGERERYILVRHVSTHVRRGADELDSLIDYTISLIDAYEYVSHCFESGFQSLLQALQRRGGRSHVDPLLNDPILTDELGAVHGHLHGAISPFAGLVDGLANVPKVADVLGAGRLEPLLMIAREGAKDRSSFMEATIQRHEQVQEQKRKGVWIERAHSHWTLMPGFKLNGAAISTDQRAFLHAFRVSNAYSLLRDLRKLRGGARHDAEEE